MTHAMQGWRIEVRPDLIAYDRRTWTPDLTDPNGPTLQVYALIIAPVRFDRVAYKPSSRELVWATAWPLRDTIYVSRPVTDSEADVLRELLDAEMRREQERERYPLVTIAAPQSDMTDAERKQMREALEGLTRECYAPIGIALHDSVPHPTLPGYHQVTVALGAPSAVRGYHESQQDFAAATQRMADAIMEDMNRRREGLAREAAIAALEALREVRNEISRSIALGEVRDVSAAQRRAQEICEEMRAIEKLLRDAPACAPPPRVPKVGDEIEVRLRDDDPWHAEIVGEPCGVHHQLKNCGTLWTLIDETKGRFWRWPEAKREAAPNLVCACGRKHAVPVERPGDEHTFRCGCGLTLHAVMLTSGITYTGR